MPPHHTQEGMKIDTARPTGVTQLTLTWVFGVDRIPPVQKSGVQKWADPMANPWKYDTPEDAPPPTPHPSQGCPCFFFIDACFLSGLLRRLIHRTIFPKKNRLICIFFFCLNPLFPAFQVVFFTVTVWTRRQMLPPPSAGSDSGSRLMTTRIARRGLQESIRFGSQYFFSGFVTTSRGFGSPGYHQVNLYHRRHSQMLCTCKCT